VRLIDAVSRMGGGMGGYGPEDDMAGMGAYGGGGGGGGGAMYGEDEHEMQMRMMMQRQQQMQAMEQYGTARHDTTRPTTH
jgi:hypothetical protein